jgi:Lsr2
MARKTIVVLQDDLDGGPADETLHFGIGGLEYEIDLSEKNAARLRKQLAPFVEHARKAGRAPRRVTRTAASRRRSRDIRAWAREQGIPLSERGRIPASVVERYEADGWGTSRRSATGVRGRSRLERVHRGHPAQDEPFCPAMSSFLPGNVVVLLGHSRAAHSAAATSSSRPSRVWRCARVSLSAAAGRCRRHAARRVGVGLPHVCQGALSSPENCQRQRHREIAGFANRL